MVEEAKSDSTFWQILVSPENGQPGFQIDLKNEKLKMLKYQIIKKC
jgi:hypothetical protein